MAELSLAFIEKLPKTDLHVHLDGSMRVETLIELAKAQGVPLPADSLERALALLDATTPAGTSSLQRDIAAGKPSELDAWTGAVVRLGAAADVPTPVHEFCYSTLLPLERRARGEITF